MADSRFEIPEKPKQIKIAAQYLAERPYLPARIWPSWFIKQTRKVDHCVVIDRHDHVGILDVVDPGHVFIADALNAVGAETIFQQGGALQGFTGYNFTAREELFQVIAAWRSFRPSRWRIPDRGSYHRGPISSSQDLFAMRFRSLHNATDNCRIHQTG